MVAARLRALLDSHIHPSMIRGEAAIIIIYLMIILMCAHVPLKCTLVVHSSALENVNIAHTHHSQNYIRTYMYMYMYDIVHVVTFQRYMYNTTTVEWVIIANYVFSFS